MYNDHTTSIVINLIQHDTYIRCLIVLYNIGRDDASIFYLDNLVAADGSHLSNGPEIATTICRYSKLAYIFSFYYDDDEYILVF
jgi:hypothetical protein